MTDLSTFIKNNQSRFVDELIDFLRIPSVSAKSDYKEHCIRAAKFLINEFNRLGLETTLVETPGNPLVLANYRASDDAPTILIYGHYDVQPEEPLNLWDTPPFEPTIRDNNIYGRGSTDDKGQIYAHIKAVESLLQTDGAISCNIKFLIEGEEEVAGENLDNFIKTNQELLKADVAIISDSSQFAADMPAICYGLRGICAVEIRVDAAKSDLHSGSFGGAVPNPCNTLCDIVSQLKDVDGRILIPGFYDNVLELEEWEREEFASLPWNEEQFIDHLGVPGLHGEKGYSALERKWARPTLDVNGIFGGYSGEGDKTIIPAWAGAKITMRLVSNQKPAEIIALFRKYVEKIAPDYIKLTINAHGGGRPVLVPRDALFMNEAVEALKFGFGCEPFFIREGGSIPIVSTINKELGLNTLLLGFGLPDDNAHAPNEKFSLRDYQRGIITSARFLQLIGQKNIT